MTEFTSEFIEKQKEQLKHISPLPWRACSCGKCGQIRNNQDCIAIATRGDWGDDYPVIKPVGGSIGGQYEVVMEQITYGHISPEIGNINSQYIAEACTNYPEALNEIEKLQQRVKELEQEHTWISVSNPAVFELERGFYLYEDERGAHMIGLFNFTDRNLLGATKIYSMKLYPPHLKNIPKPMKEE